MRSASFYWQPLSSLPSGYSAEKYGVTENITAIVPTANLPTASCATSSSSRRATGQRKTIEPARLAKTASADNPYQKPHLEDAASFFISFLLLPFDYLLLLQ